MSLNIKNPRVHELAKQAAEQFGMSQTSVIEEALVRLLATAPQPAGERVDRVYRVLAAVDTHLSEHDRHDLAAGLDTLYDDAGLPT